MFEIAFEQAPDARNMAEINRLLVAHRQPRENADDLGIALGAKNGISGTERIAVESS